jgi:hypothetical protein
MHEEKMPPKIAILGWGSLLWDKSEPEFDARHHEWRFDGPILKLEFTRKSSSRLNALTLVIDPIHGQDCRVAYALSKRTAIEDAISDLCAREKTKEKYIGTVFGDASSRRGRDGQSVSSIFQWAKDSSVDAVIWTDLAGNFDLVPPGQFVKAAVNHLQLLTPEGKTKAAEYVWKAPDFIVTPLRSALEVEPWFKKP